MSLKNVFAKSYEEANRYYNYSCDLSKNWISRYYDNSGLDVEGIKIQDVQPFSQQHFFSCLLEKLPVEDNWSQYPRTTERPFTKSYSYILRFIHIFFGLFLSQRVYKIEGLTTEIVFVGSSRHLRDLLPLIIAIKRKYKILVVGKIDQDLQSKFSKRKIRFVSIDNEKLLSTRVGRLKDLIKYFFALRTHVTLPPILRTDDWQRRLAYLRFDQFPKIASLLRFAAYLFTNVRPKIVITPSSNDVFSAAFCLMAKKHGVKVLTLQHGYTSMGIDKTFYNTDYILCWGKIPQKIYSGDHENSIIVGSPFIFKEKMGNIENFTQRKKISLLILLSPHFDNDRMFLNQPPNKTYKRLFESLAKLPSNFDIIIRSHPDYRFKEELDDIDLPPNFYFSSNKTGQEAIKNANIVLTQPTTAAFLAILKGKPVFFFNNSWITEKLGDPLVNSGASINIELKKLDKTHEIILEFIKNKNQLKHLRGLQKKFIEEYCAYLGFQSKVKIEKLIQKLLKE